MGDRAARMAGRASQTLPGLQAETDRLPKHAVRKWICLVPQPLGHPARLTASSDHLLAPFIPAVRPYVDFVSGDIRFTDLDGTIGHFNIEIGHVVRDSTGAVFIVASIRFHNDSACDTGAEDAYLMTKGLFVLTAFQIKERGLGSNTKADLGKDLVEVSIQTITAVGEATASDPSYSEVKLLRIRMEQGDGDYANSMYPGIEDPALHIEQIKELPSGRHMAVMLEKSKAIMEKSRMLTNGQKMATNGPEKISADKVRSQFGPLAAAVCAPYLASGADLRSEEWVSTSLLSDELANLLPGTLVDFLPREQQQRLANAKAAQLAAPALKPKGKSKAAKARAVTTPAPKSQSNKAAASDGGNSGKTGRGVGGGRKAGGHIQPEVTSPGGSVLKKRVYVNPGGSGDASSSRAAKRGANIQGVASSSSSAPPTSLPFSPSLITSEVADALRAEVERLRNENRANVRQKVAFESLALGHIKSLTELTARLHTDTRQLISLVMCNPAMAAYTHTDIPGVSDPAWLTDLIARRLAADSEAASGSGAEALDYS